MIQLALIASLTAIVLKSSDPVIIHTAVGIIGAAIGTAVMRSRAEASGSGKGGLGTSLPPSILGALGGGAVALVVVSLLHGCASTPTAAQQARVASYEAELLACVAVAKLEDAGIASSRACRERVMRAYGRLDGGAE